MGAYTCEFGVVHRVCRCPTPHTIKCNEPQIHQYLTPGTRAERVPNKVCLVWRMKQNGDLPLGKHEAHPAHIWWYTSSGGGHQMDTDPGPTERAKKYSCPGEE